MGKKAGLTLEDVVDSATGIADRDGLDRLTLAAVAHELGIKPPSLYNHVDGLDGLTLLLALRGAEALTIALGEALERVDGNATDQRGVVRALCLAFRRFAHQHPGLYAAFNAGTSLTDDPEMLDAIRRPIPLVLSVLGPFGLDEHLTVHAMRVFRGTLHGFITLEEGFNYPLSADDSYLLAIDLFVDGVRALGERGLDAP